MFSALLPWLFLLLAAGLLIAAVVYLSSRFRQVPEGHVAVITRLEKFVRTAGPGLYLLHPLEEEVATINIRQREATAVVPNVFTEGGLPVNVNLRYAYGLDPKRMNRSEIFYTDAERAEQQRTLLKRVFQDLMYQMATLDPPTHAPGGPNDPNERGNSGDRVDLVKLFSPFAGAKARRVQVDLEPAVRTALAEHGIMVTSAPVLINGLSLPPEISSAYIDLLRTDLNSSARSDFIRRVHNAAPQMTEAGLIQLFNVIQNPSADVHSFFSGGTVNTELLLDAGETNYRHTVPVKQPRPLHYSGPTHAPATHAGPDGPDASTDGNAAGSEGPSSPPPPSPAGPPPPPQPGPAGLPPSPPSDPAGFPGLIASTAGGASVTPTPPTMPGSPGPPLPPTGEDQPYPVPSAVTGGGFDRDYPLTAADNAALLTTRDAAS
jgi:hypothetical protein